MLERPVEIAFLPLDGGELAIEKRAVGRRGDRGGVSLHRFVEPAGARRVARARNPLLGVPELQHLDAARQIGERGIGGERSGERGERLRLAVQREQRLPAGHERRHVRGLWAQLQRAIEVRQRRLRVLARELEVAEREFRRIEIGRGVKRGAELALRRLEIAVLKELPAARLEQCGHAAGERRRNRRLRVLRKLRRRDDRRRHDLRRARAERDERGEQQLAHRQNITSAVAPATTTTADRRSAAARRRRSTRGRRASRAARRTRAGRAARCDRDRRRRRDRR